MDEAGTLYIAEREAGRVRQMLASGRVRTLAQGVGCNSLIPASDGEGGVYCSDPDANLVRRISRKGAISTVAGTGVKGFSGDGGLATAAQLNSPGGLALDSRGNLYIADAANWRVRKVTRDGVISTVAGNGREGRVTNGQPAVEQPMQWPESLAVGSDGTLFVGGSSGSWIVSPDGTVSTSGVQGGSSGRQGLRFLAMDPGGRLYARDGHQIFRVAAAARLEKIAGNDRRGYSGDGGPAMEAGFVDIAGMAFDRSGRIYLADYSADAVRMLTPVQPVQPGQDDLRVDLQVAGGSNTIQVGADIPLVVTFSSSTPQRYLEPCGVFNTDAGIFPYCPVHQPLVDPNRRRWRVGRPDATGWPAHHHGQEVSTGSVQGNSWRETRGHPLPPDQALPFRQAREIHHPSCHRGRPE